MAGYMANPRLLDEATKKDVKLQDVFGCFF